MPGGGAGGAGASAGPGERAAGGGGVGGVGGFGAPAEAGAAGSPAGATRTGPGGFLLGDGGPGDEGFARAERRETVLAEDRRWVGDIRAAAFCALSLGVLLHLMDFSGGTLDGSRSALWTTLSVTLFAVLFPPRVTAGRHWLSVRGLFRERRVSTDLLTRAARRGGVSQRIVLTDIRGRRVEVDPSTLAGNPLLWHELDRGVRKSRERGLLGTGSAMLQHLSDRIEADTVRAVFEVSELR
ncbi:hypothetical protein [Streptomyces sp. NPDC001985]|uniref:hypothetical protein n=1 Tax=Streptomyces sp. NPDC001985 TaxID=3154406 RepID=UPI00331BADE1